MCESGALLLMRGLEIGVADPGADGQAVLGFAQDDPGQGVERQDLAGFSELLDRLIGYALADL